MRILRSKITVPQIPSDSVPRPRLTADLYEGRSLAFVAPAGFGKTTYAMQELRASGQPIAWLSLQPEDREPTRFCTLFWESVSVALPAFKESGIDLEPENLESPASLVEALCYFAQEAETTPSWICFDNLESVQSETAIADAINQLLIHGSKRLRVALTSRESKGLGLSVLEGRGLVRIVRQSELAFSRRDISALLAAFGQPNSGNVIDAAWDRTQGWPVAVSMWTRQADTERHETTSEDLTPESFDSFVDEVLLRGLEPSFRDFLFRTSFFDVLDGSASEAAGFSSEETRRHLQTLASSALPVLESRGDEFQVHAALRDALLRGYRTSASRSDFEQSVERAAKQLEEGPQLESSIDLLIEHGLFVQLFETALRQDQRLRSCWHRFDEWLASVPAEYQHDPVYIRWKGFHLVNLGNQEEAASFLADRIEGLAHTEHGVQLWIMYNFALHNTGGAPIADQLVKEAESWRLSWPGAAHDVDWLLANGYARELRFAEAIEVAEPIVDRFPFHGVEIRAWILNWRSQLGHDVITDLLRLARDPVPEVQVGSTLVAGLIAAELLLDYGRLQESVAVAAENIRRGSEAKIPGGHDEDHIRLIEGFSRWRSGDEEEGLLSLEEHLPRYAAHSRDEGIRGRILVEFLRLQTRDLSERTRRAPDASLDAIDPVALGLPDDTRLQFRCLQALRSRDDAATVTACGVEVLETAERSGLVPWTVTGAFVLSWGRFLQDRFDEADAALEVGLASLESCGWKSYPMAWKDLTAYVFVRSVETQQRVNVSRELVTGEEYIPVGAAFGRSLALAAEARDADRVGRLLDEAKNIGVRGLSAFVPMTDELKEIRNDYVEWSREAPLPPLRIRMLGRFSVDGPDGPRRFRRSASKTVLQMLLLVKSSPLHEEQLMEQCWPETDLDKGRRNLQTTINDLRKDLDPQYTARGNSYVNYSDGSYSLSLPHGSSVDLNDLSDVVSRFRGEDSSDSKVEEVVRHLELGRFDLLPEARYESFCELERSRVRSIIEKGTLAAVAALEKRGRRREAVDLLRAVLDEEPLWQEGVEELMKTLRADGRNIAAIRVFRRYEKRLLNESGLLPDDRLVALLPLEGRTG